MAIEIQSDGTMKVGAANAQQIYHCDISNLEKDVIADGKLIVKPFSFWNNIDRNEINYFLYVHGIYVVPTEELINYLKENIVGSAIEIGAGNGAISRALNIPITDSRMQELEEIKMMYAMSGQPVIKYPDDVEKLNSDQAIVKYKPDTVIGCFITHKFKAEIGNGNMYGVEEENILKSVKRYINVGNLTTHKSKPILKMKHEEHYFEWLITRAVNQKDNRIFIWNK